HGGGRGRARTASGPVDADGSPQVLGKHPSLERAGVRDGVLRRLGRVDLPHRRGRGVESVADVPSSGVGSARAVVRSESVWRVLWKVDRLGHAGADAAARRGLGRDGDDADAADRQGGLTTALYNRSTRPTRFIKLSI